MVKKALVPIRVYWTRCTLYFLVRQLCVTVFPRCMHAYKIYSKRKAQARNHQPPAMSMSMSSSSDASDLSSNISEDSVLKTDSEDGEVVLETEKRVKRRFFFNLLLIRRRRYLRSKKWSPPRLIWNDYVAELMHQNEFNVTFRMSHSLFSKLVDLLRAKLEVDEKQAL